MEQKLKFDQTNINTCVPILKFTSSIWGVITPFTAPLFASMSRKSSGIPNFLLLNVKNGTQVNTTHSRIRGKIKNRAEVAIFFINTVIIT